MEPSGRVVKWGNLRHTECHSLEIPWQLGVLSVARTSFIILVFLGVLTGIIFAADPSLDLQVASFFHDLAPQPGARRFDQSIDIVRQVVPLVIITTVAPSAVAFVMSLFCLLR